MKEARSASNPQNSPLFKNYLLSQVVSSAGSSSVSVLVPLIAVLMLDASPTVVGGLVALMMAVDILVSPYAGAWADSTRNHAKKLVIFIVLSSVMSFVLFLLPFAGWLEIWVLFAWAGVKAGLSALGGPFGSPMLHVLTHRENRTHAVGRLHSLSEASGIAGQAAAPAATSFTAPSYGMILPGVTSLVAAAVAWPLRKVDKEEPDSDQGPMKPPVHPIIAYRRVIPKVMRSGSFLAVVAVGSVTGLLIPIEYEYALNVLDLQPALLGVLLVMGAVGGIPAGFITGPLSQRLGSRGTIALGGALTVVSLAVLFAGQWANPLFSHLAFGFYEFLSAVGGVLMVATIMGRLQAITPVDEIGRTMTAAGLALEISGLAFIGIGTLLALGLLPGWLILLALIGTPFAMLLLLLDPNRKQ